MPSGTKFIKHEFDEAIAIQQSIIDSAKKLIKSHPVAEVKRQLETGLDLDQEHLTNLLKFGAPFDARGKREDVAEALGSLAEDTSKNVGSKDSDAYEAHAVLLTLKRKQQDSADAMVKIARDRKDTDLRDAATQMKKEIKASADALSASLGDFAVRIASA